MELWAGSVGMRAEPAACASVRGRARAREGERGRLREERRGEARRGEPALRLA